MLSVSRAPMDSMPMASPSSLPIILPPRPPPQRPKLSLNTQHTRILGKAASLRLETLSAVSPTVRNTYSNAYEQPSTAPALQRPGKPRLCIDSSATTPVPAASTPDSASTLSSTLTSASHDSVTSSVPYKQPHHLASILANSPVKSVAPRKMAAARPMFPAEKHVSFRSPLEEEIKTVKYTLAHSDLASSSSTLSSIASTVSAASSPSDSLMMHHSAGSDQPCILVARSSTSSLPSSSLRNLSPASSTTESGSRTSSPRTGEKRDSSSSEDDSDSCPETPVAGRRKRTRDWRWTLGPLPGASASTSSLSGTTASEDSS